MKTIIYNLPEVTTGSDLEEDLLFRLPADPQFDLAYATAKIQFRKSPGDPFAQEFKPGNGTLVIEPPYAIRWPAQKITAKPGIYQWQLRIRFTDRDEFPWGGTITVKTAITTI